MHVRQGGRVIPGRRGGTRRENKAGGQKGGANDWLSAMEGCCALTGWKKGCTLRQCSLLAAPVLCS